MFDFINSDKKEALATEKREKDFVRERDTFNSHHTDDAAYLETQTQKSDLIRWQQEFKEDLDDLYHELLSEIKTSNGWEPKTYKEYDEEKRVYVIKKISPLCSPVFADQLKSMALKPWLSKSAVNSNLSEKKILSMLRNLHNDVATAISDTEGMNGIKSISDANYIARMIKNYVDPAAFRALDGWTKRTDSTMIKRIESQQDVINPQNNGWLSGVFKGG